MSKLESVKDLGRFLLARKRLWLIPILAVLLLLSVLLVFAEGSAAAPFIYTLF